MVGGHDIRSTSLVESVERLHRESRVFDGKLVKAARDELAAIDARIRPGTLFRCGTTIEKLADDSMLALRARVAARRRQAAASRPQVVPAGRRASTRCSSSTWPRPSRRPTTSTCRRAGRTSTGCSTKAPPRPLSASSLYAIAALDLGMPYINFTPSPGATPPAIGELAELRKTCHAGQDGKTGETLLKSVLAPMFAARNLEVMSWVGHNIFGNMDGQVLDDPVNKSAKIQGKDQLLGHILGYDPQTLVTIEYIRSMGDWKTAWDHIHFRGFLGTPMTHAIHLAGLRFAAGGAAGFGPRAVRRTVAPPRRNRPLEPLGKLFQTAAGARKSRLRPPVGAARRVGRECSRGERCAGRIARASDSVRIGIARSISRIRLDVTCRSLGTMPARTQNAAFAADSRSQRRCLSRLCSARGKDERL